MLRRSLIATATAIPRQVWDPAQHEPSWVDSYATAIADRRMWPAKTWSVGLVPQTPEDWAHYSVRNLAYAYNGALRAAASFPQMIPLYQEMKQRGVEVDIDTMYVMLSRAARYDKMPIPDIFRLYDELSALGARTDIAIAEILHTVWDHAEGADPHWREHRRRHLVGIYNALALADATKYGQQGHHNLLLKQLGRYRANLRTLKETVRYDVWAATVSQLSDPDDIIQCLSQMLWDRCQVAGEKGENAPYTELKSGGGGGQGGASALTVPTMTGILRRLPVGSPVPWSSNSGPLGNSGSAGGSAAADLLGATASFDSSYRGGGEGEEAGGEGEEDAAAGPAANFEDIAVNRVFAAALERLVDGNLLHAKGARDDKVFLLATMNLCWKSGTMISADVFAQAMEILKYSNTSSTPKGRDFTERSAKIAFRQSHQILDNSYGASDQQQQQQQSPSSAAGSQQQEQQQQHDQLGHWRATKGLDPAADARVVGRYLAARDPWHAEKFSLTRGRFESFPAEDVRRTRSSAGGSAAESPSADSEVPDQATKEGQEGGKTDSEDYDGAPRRIRRGGGGASDDALGGGGFIRTAASVRRRWDDVQQVLDNRAARQRQNEAGVVGSSAPSAAENDRRLPTFEGIDRTLVARYRNCPNAMELFSGQAVFLRNMFFNDAGENVSSVAVAKEIFQCARDLKYSMDLVCDNSGVGAEKAFPTVDGDGSASLEPDIECWESLLVLFRALRDYAVRAKSRDSTEKAELEAFDREIAEVYSTMVTESKDKWGGKFKMLWLQEM